jgi:hypothetical protein
VGTTVTRTILTGAGTPSNNAQQNASQFSMRLDGGTFATPLVGSGAVDFFAWCIEPRETISLNVTTSYTVLPLSQAATNIGGIGDAKAAQMRELFGRFQSSFATPVTAQHAAAMQIAIWEIVRETPGAALNVFNGNIFYASGSDGIAGTLALANSFVTAIDGTGPMAQNLLTLSNGTFGVQGSGTQDLIVQTMSLLHGRCLSLALALLVLPSAAGFRLCSPEPNGFGWQLTGTFLPAGAPLLRRAAYFLKSSRNSIYAACSFSCMLYHCLYRLARLGRLVIRLVVGERRCGKL